MSRYARFIPALLVVFLLGAPNSFAQTERLNIISIVTDDQARWAVGAYGNREVRTPNMDRLAREGALFTNAFVATPVCSPSRATFLTGRYPTQTGITDFISGVEAQAGVGLPADALTWTRTLQTHGYTTGLVGKWHLGIKPPHHPSRFGINHFFGSLPGSFAPVDPTFDIDGERRKLPGYGSNIVTDEALRFVEANREKQFALLLHFREPHTPYGPMPEEDTRPFRSLDPTVPHPPGWSVTQTKQWTREYYAAIHAADRNIGRLLQKLDELNLSEKTIVLFTSDHGYMIGHHGLHTKGNGWSEAGGVRSPKRPNMFDDSIRVPLIVRWQGVVKPGTVIDQFVSNVDTFASVLGMLEIPVPQKAKHEGMNFTPLLKGQSVKWRDAIFGQYDLHNEGLAFMRMIRTGEWKLVRHHFTSLLDELYDLKHDPGETKNLYREAAQTIVREELQARLTQWQRLINDPVLRASEAYQRQAN